MNNISNHPDLHQDLNDEKLELFYNACEAYKIADLETIRIIHTMISDFSAKNFETNTFFSADTRKRAAFAIDK